MDPGGGRRRERNLRHDPEGRDGVPDGAAADGASNVEGLHYDPRSDRFMGLRRQYQAGGVSTPYRASSTDAMTWTEVAETMGVHGVSQFVTGELP
jgi:hypothetical protein